MELLEPEAVVPVPAIQAAGGFGRRDWSYFAMEFCAGRPLDELQAELKQAALMEVAAQTGRMARRLHAVDPEPLAAIDKGERWDALVERRRREVLPEVLEPGAGRAGHRPRVAGVVGRGAGCFANGRAGCNSRRSERRAPIDGRARQTMGRVSVDRLRRCPHRRALLRVDAAVARSVQSRRRRCMRSSRRTIPACWPMTHWGGGFAASTLLHDYGTHAIAELFETSSAICPARSLDKSGR